MREHADKNGTYASIPITFEIDDNGCHICTSHSLYNGYPWAKRNGKFKKISRHICEEKFGPLDIKTFVRHKCPGGGNPACINPDHLEIGTHLDNVRDMMENGRQSRGEKHLSSKLNEGRVEYIRTQTRFLQKELAYLFGVSEPSISKVKTRRNWKESG